MTPKILMLIISIFGHESMRVGPFNSLADCMTVLRARSHELDVNYSKIRGGGLPMAGTMIGGRFTPGPTVFRADIKMRCEFDDQPTQTLKGTLG